jgi:hypothetical protein
LLNLALANPTFSNIPAMAGFGFRIISDLNYWRDIRRALLMTGECLSEQLSDNQSGRLLQIRGISVCVLNKNSP